ncbi:MAG: ACT domain-containing protein [bacterium]|nr:ACT domain-containing protein [bacterium]
MRIRPIAYDFAVCKVQDYSGVNLESPFCFIGKTDEERSLVCFAQDVPANVTHREDGWRAFGIEGELDFSLIGILARICGILAEREIGVFAVSTFNTDYILVKAEHFDSALSALAEAGYQITHQES